METGKRDRRPPPPLLSIVYAISITRSRKAASESWKSMSCTSMPDDK